jgi:hypothetical protein
MQDGGSGDLEERGKGLIQLLEGVSASMLASVNANTDSAIHAG